MSHYFDTLQAEILRHSHSADWATAVEEWSVEDMYEEQEGVCTCGYSPITQHNVICNKHTKTALVVGRICVKRFLPDTEVEKIWRALDKLKKQTSTSIPLVLIQAAEQYRWCEEVELNFLRRIRRKRALSREQLARRNKLSRQILYKALWRD